MAGFETTASFIPNGLLALIQHPDQMAALRGDPSLIPSAVEEMLRYDPTATASLLRYATEDLTLGGVEISKNDAVVVSWAGANHDPRRFSQPDVFDVRRGDANHIAFARGIHYCLGRTGQTGESDRLRVAARTLRRHPTRDPSQRTVLPDNTQHS